MNSNKQQGFTLIELVIVIVILGILAVTAAPKFLNIQGDAQASTVKAMSGSMKAASDMIKAKALIAGVANVADGTINLDSSTTVITDFGYPEHDWETAWDEMLDASITLTTSATAACTNQFCVDESHDLTGITADDLARDLSGLTDANVALVIYPNGTALNGNCYAYYLYDDTGATDPIIGTVTSGC